MSTASSFSAQTVNTGGGAVNTGTVSTAGGNFIGRDFVQHIHQTGAREALYVNVPPLPPYLFGREALVADLMARLTNGESTALSAQGLPGVGKTTLAVVLAHHRALLAHFSDGVLWAGVGPQPNVALIQAQWATALGVDLGDLADPYARRQRLDNVIGQRKLLLVLDDVWDREAAYQLRSAGPHVTHLLTTRDQALAATFAGRDRALAVATLDPEPGYQLLQALAADACAADGVAAKALVGAVGGLPLALELLGGYLAAPERSLFPDLSQEAFAALADPQARLQLAGERLGRPGAQTTLQATIELSLAALAQVRPSAVTTFYALGAFVPRPATFTRTAAQTVTGGDGGDLALLISRNLVEKVAERSPAAELVEAKDKHSPAEPQLALHQTLADVARTQTTVAQMADHRDYYKAIVNEDREDWQRIEAIYDQFVHVWQREVDTDPASALLVTLADGINHYQRMRGLRQAELSWLQKALAVITATEEHREIARFKNNIGNVYASLGEKQQALAYFERALPLYHQASDRRGAATTLNNRGLVYAALGEKQQALAYFEQVLPLFCQVGDHSGEGGTLNNIGSIYDALGKKQQALAYYEQALPLRRQVGDRSGEATTLNNIGLVYDALGEKGQALAYFEQALPLDRQVGDRSGEATTLNNIGKVYSALGEKAQALAYFEQALSLRREVGDRGGEATTLNNIGSIYSALGEKQQALIHYEQALSLHRQVGDRSGEATTLNNIGRVYDALGKKRQALAYYEQALPLRRQVGDRSGEATTLNNIGSLYSALGEKQQALNYFEQALLLRRQVGDRSGEATTLNNIGSVYDDLGEQQQALAYYEQALPLRRQVGDRSGEANTLNNLAVLHYGDGAYERTAALFGEAVSLQEQIGDVMGLANTLYNLAFVLHRQLGRSEEAISLLQRSIRVFQDKGLPFDTGGGTVDKHQRLLTEIEGR